MVSCAILMSCYHGSKSRLCLIADFQTGQPRGAASTLRGNHSIRHRCEHCVRRRILGLVDFWRVQTVIQLTTDVYIECAVECQNLTAVSRVVTHARARQTEQLGTILLDAALSDPSQWMGTIKYITKVSKQRRLSPNW